MNKKHLFPLLLLTISLAAADNHEPTTDASMETVPLTQRPEGAGTIQHMGVYERITQNTRQHPLATIYTSGGCLHGTIATGVKLGAPTSTCATSTLPGLYCGTAWWCFLGLCATPLGEKLRQNYLKPCAQNCFQLCAKHLDKYCCNPMDCCCIPKDDED